MTTPHIRSISERLKGLAREQSATYAEILTQFLIERAVVRLVADPILFQHLIFKGGFVGLRVYGSPRFTTDLDAVIHLHDAREVIQRAKVAMINALGDHVWFEFETEVDLATQSEYGGTRLQYRFGLGVPPLELRRSQIFNLDIGTGDLVTPEPRKEKTQATLGQGEVSWRVYPVETIIAEKLHPLVRLGGNNSRSKDIFDLAFLLPKATPGLLKMAIEKTFAHRGDPLPPNFSDFLEALNRNMLRRGWRAATVNIRPSPNFDQAYGDIIVALRSLSI